MADATVLNGSLLDEDYDLSAEQVEVFHRDGWLKLPGLLDATTAKDIYARLAGFGGLEPSEAEKWMTDPAYQKVLKQKDGMAWSDDFFRDLATSRRLSSAALALMKVDAASFILDMAFIKPGGGGGDTPMHQDYPHWPFDRRGTLTIWVALTDLSEETGTLRFLRGSHLEGPLGRFSRAADDDLRNDHPDIEARCPVEGGSALKAGDATVHWDMTVHGARGNTTPNERAAYTARYVPAGTRYTGSPHRHFDGFGLETNQRFDESGSFPTVTR